MLCRKSHIFLSKWKHIFYSSSSCFCWHGSDCFTTRFQPKDCNLFLTGGLEGSLRLSGMRAGMLVYEYVRDRGPILDIEFSVNGQQFISSSDVSGSSPSENATSLWDVRRQVPLLNQVNILYFGSSLLGSFSFLSPHSVYIILGGFGCFPI